jgi:hypothetical protein
MMYSPDGRITVGIVWVVPALLVRGLAGQGSTLRRCQFYDDLGVDMNERGRYILVL